MSLNPPSDKAERDLALAEYQFWIKAGGGDELCPQFMIGEFENQRLTRVLLGAVMHSALLCFRYLSLKLHFWPSVGWFTKLRILTDSYSFEPGQCGLNSAYTYLGLSRFNSGDVIGAISALKYSGLVWPCPHNTSFGLQQHLVKVLGSNPEAKEAVDEYMQLDKSFRA